MITIVRISLAIATLLVSFTTFAANSDNNATSATQQSAAFASTASPDTNTTIASNDIQTPAEQAAQAAKAIANNKTVNINTADAKEIAKNLQGIGKKKAEAIVSYREKHGLFKSTDELTQIKGINKKLLEKNRNRITLG